MKIDPERSSLLPANNGRRAKPGAARVCSLVDIQERIAREKAEQQASEALSTARALALAHLPRSKTSEQQVCRKIRLGKDLWVRVTYTAVGDQPLPFGEDRVILAGLVHLALKQNSPFVTFEQAGDILELFNLDRSGSGYRRFRQRIDRIKSLDIEVETQVPTLGFKEGWGTRVIERWSLPTRQELRSAAAGQLHLPAKQTGVPPFHVELGASLWKHLQEGGRHLLMVRHDLMQMFVSRPLGWDYALFLFHRCGSAESFSIVPHEALVDMFGSPGEADRNLFRRLRAYHDEIMVATRGPDGNPLLNASLEAIGLEQPSGRRGPRRKLWGLKVAPSASLLGKERITNIR